MASQMPRGIKASPVADQVTFRGHTGRGVVAKDMGGTIIPRRLTFTGSSDLYDLIGDRMLPSMLEDMRSFEPGKAIFANHSYVLPKSAIGRNADNPHIEVATATKSTPFVNAGDEYLEMVFSFDILPNNPDAVQIYDYIKEYDLIVGASVGVQITDYSVERDEDGYPLGLLIAHGILLEISTVGIPCNYQSWVRQAVSGLQKQFGAPLPLDEPKEIVYMARHWADFECDVDQLVLSRIAKRLEVKPLDLTRFDAEDQTTLRSLDQALRQSGLYIETLPGAA